MNVDTHLLYLCEKIAAASFNSIKNIAGTRDAYKTVYMGAYGTPTKLIDDIAENAIIAEMISNKLNLRIISEECGEKIVGLNPEIAIIIDPVDGTHNAAMGIPFYSVSIAISDVDVNEIYFGYVEDLVNHDVYYAQKNRGAYLNGYKIQVSDKFNLKELSISVYGNQSIQITNLCQKVRRLRVFGCISLELCYVACGKLDAFIDMRESIRLTDVAAGKLILEESAGLVTDDKGNKLILKEGIINRVSMIATNVKVHHNILNQRGK